MQLFFQRVIRKIIQLHRRLIERDFRHPALAEAAYIALLALVIGLVIGPWIEEWVNHQWGKSAGMVVGGPAQVGLLLLVFLGLRTLRRRLPAAVSRPRRAHHVKPGLLGRLNALYAETVWLHRLLLSSYRGYLWVDVPILCATMVVPVIWEIHLVSELGWGDPGIFVVLCVTLISVPSAYERWSVRLLGATPGVIIWGEKERFDREYGACTGASGESQAAQQQGQAATREEGNENCQGR